MSYFSGIQFVGWYDSPKNSRFFDCTFQDYYGLQYNHSGRFLYCCGDSPLKQYSGPHLFITRPGVRFRYGVIQGEVRHHCYVCFRGERVAKYVQTGLLSETSLPIAIANHDKFHMSMIELMELLDAGAVNDDLAVHTLEGLLLQSHQMPLPATHNTELLEQIENVAGEIRKHPERSWSFEDIAARLGISYAHFRRLFKQHIGFPPSRFVLTIRLQRASNMLIHSNCQIGEIAEQLGFYDIYHFSKLFRKQFSLAPGKYRKDFARAKA